MIYNYAFFKRLQLDSNKVLTQRIDFNFFFKKNVLLRDITTLRMS